MTGSHTHIVHKDTPLDGCETHVEVEFQHPSGGMRQTRHFGVVQFEAICKSLDANAPIDLRNRYVKGFSIAQYRASRKMDTQASVNIENFDASNAFFDIDEEADFSHVCFKGEKTNFSGAHFANGPLNFYKSEFSATQVDFSACHFGSGAANFQFAEFHSNLVTFHKASFLSGDVTFINALFGDARVDFREVDFGDGDVDFHYSKFGNGNISFDKAQFGGGNISFKRVDFGHGKVDFKRVQFGDGEIDFSEAEFKSGKVVFRSSIFGRGHIHFDQVQSSSDMVFDGAEFGTGNLSFFQATARKISLKLCHLNNYVDLRINEAEKIDLSYTIVRDIVDLIPTERAPVTLKQLDFSGMRNLGRLYIDWKLNRVKRLVLSQTHTTERQKSEQFLVLKETYASAGRYNDEDRAYVMYKRYELKANLHEALAKSKLNGIWAYPEAISKWLLFDKIGLYATEPLRVLLSVSIIYTLFSLLYMLLPSLANTYIDTGADGLSELGLIAKSFYFSAITFLTVGYGDFYPVGIMRVFASIEGYVGVFLMGYFSVAFVRKVLR